MVITHFLDEDEYDLTHEIVAAIASKSSESPIQLSPLFGAVDPDALETLIRKTPRESNIIISFMYDDFYISIDQCKIQICSADEIIEE